MLATLSVPEMWEISKHSMRRGGSGRPSASSSASEMALEVGFNTRKRCSKLCRALEPTKRQQGLFVAALRRVDLHLAAALFGEQFLQQISILELHGDVDNSRDGLPFGVNLHQEES